MANRASHKEAERVQPPPACRSSGGKSSKLRDSCHTCAVSKVKCPKEKPTCSRCESRGTPCQYFLTKRPGRRRDSEINGSRAGHSRLETNVNEPNDIHKSDTSGGRSGNRERDGGTIQAATLSLSDRFFSRSTTPPSAMSPYMDSYPGTPTHQNLTPPPLDTNNSGLFAGLGEDDILPEFADFHSDVNDMDFVMSGIQSPFDFPMLDAGGGGSMAVTGPRPDIGSLLMPPENTGNDLTAASKTSPAGDAMRASSSAGSSSLSSGAQSLTANRNNVPRAIQPPPCGCLLQGLDLLKALSSTQSTPHATSSGGTPEPSMGVDANSTLGIHSSGNHGPARAVLAKNKQSIEAVNKMLACVSCAGDSFLLTVSSMIVLKVLERYAAAARGPVAVGEMDLGRVANMMMANSAYPVGQRDDQGLERKSAQVVLSELHRVQKVVNQLSPKLKAPNDEEGGGMGVGLDFWGQGSHLIMVGAGSKRDTVPASFSTDTLDRLEKDVRKSLSSLSSDIIEVLRQS